MRILFLHKQLLFPRDTGGKIRVLNVLKHLAKRHDIVYVSNVRSGEEENVVEMTNLGLDVRTSFAETSRRGSIKFWTEAFANLLSPDPFTVSRNYDRGLHQLVHSIVEKEPFDLLICDTCVMVPHVRGISKVPMVLFQHNVESQILQRHATIGGMAKRFYMSDQHRKMEKFERECGSMFQRVIAVSELDKEFFQSRYGWTHVDAIDTAVDESYFGESGKPVSGRVVFVGSMDWLPNQEGVEWFVEQVWPIVKATHPQAQFHVVGRSPPPSVLSLDGREGVKVWGRVADVRSHLSDAEVVVVPLLVGGGTRLKIYEAMASRRALVSTQLGAEGLPIIPGEHYLAADSPKEFADAVVRLLTNQAERDRLRIAADDFVRSRFSSASVAEQFETICNNALTSDSSSSKAICPQV